MNQIMLAYPLCADFISKKREAQSGPFLLVADHNIQVTESKIGSRFTGSPRYKTKTYLAGFERAL